MTSNSTGDSSEAAETPTRPLLQIENLSVEFKQGSNQTRVVDDISFQVDRGEIVALVGESGSGKSVTAHSILRLLPYPAANHPSGTIVLDAKKESESNGEIKSPPLDLLTIPEWEIRGIRGNRISMIFQEPMVALNPLHTVYKQIAEILRLHSRLNSKSELKKRVIELLDEVGIRNPESRLDHYPSQLSGGQRQRVMIAMALANRPELLIADEPTTALDVTIQLQILNLLKSLQTKHNLAILLITHDFNVVKKMASRCVVMQHGKIVEKASTEALFGWNGINCPDRHPYTKALLEAEPMGEPLTNPTDRDQTLLSVDNLKVWFPIFKGVFKRVVDHFKAVDGISLNLKAGETIGIVGESGSGKSTLAMAILRLLESKGKITYRGQFLDKLSSNHMRPLRNQIQVVFQDPFASLSPRMSVEQIIEEGLKIHYPDLTTELRQKWVVNALEEVDLDPECRHRYPHEFSGGQRQRISIARALVLQPKLVVLDEPTSALDRSVQGQVIDLLRKLQHKYALSYLFISHDLKVVRALSHKVMVMQAGKVVESGSTESIFETPQSDYTKALLEAAH